MKKCENCGELMTGKRPCEMCPESSAEGWPLLAYRVQIVSGKHTYDVIRQSVWGKETTIRSTFATLGEVLRDGTWDDRDEAWKAGLEHAARWPSDIDFSGRYDPFDHDCPEEAEGTGEITVRVSEITITKATVVEIE